jgi:uncharacterized membrane protein
MRTRIPEPGVIWRTFLKGLVVVIPAVVTLAVLVWLGASLERVLGGLLRPILPGALYLPGMGIAAGIVLTFAAGIAMQMWITRRLLVLAERLVERIPLAKTIYSAARDVMSFVSRSDRARDLDQVVLVSLPDGVTMVGFITEAKGPIVDGVSALDAADAPSVAVYFPMSYQIGGFTTFVPRSCVHRVDMGMQEAMRWVLTAGVSDGKPRTDPPGPGINDRAAPRSATR